MDRRDLDILQGLSGHWPGVTQSSSRKGNWASGTVLALPLIKPDDTNSTGLALVMVIILGVFPDCWAEVFHHRIQCQTFV